MKKSLLLLPLLALAVSNGYAGTGSTGGAPEYALTMPSELLTGKFYYSDNKITHMDADGRTVLGTVTVSNTSLVKGLDLDSKSAIAQSKLQPTLRLIYMAAENQSRASSSSGSDQYTTQTDIFGVKAGFESEKDRDTVISGMQQLQGKTKSYSMMIKKLSKAQTDLSAATTELTQLENDKTSLTNQVAKLNNDLQEATNKNTQYVAHIEQLKQQVILLAKNLDSLKHLTDDQIAQLGTASDQDALRTAIIQNHQKVEPSTAEPKGFKISMTKEEQNYNDLLVLRDSLTKRKTAIDNLTQEQLIETIIPLLTSNLKDNDGHDIDFTDALTQTTKDEILKTIAPQLVKADPAKSTKFTSKDRALIAATIDAINGETIAETLSKVEAEITTAQAAKATKKTGTEIMTEVEANKPKTLNDTNLSAILQA